MTEVCNSLPLAIWWYSHPSLIRYRMVSRLENGTEKKGPNKAKKELLIVKKYRSSNTILTSYWNNLCQLRHFTPLSHSLNTLSRQIKNKGHSIPVLTFIEPAYLEKNELRQKRVYSLRKSPDHVDGSIMPWLGSHQVAIDPWWGLDVIRAATVTRLVERVRCRTIPLGLSFLPKYRPRKIL